MKQNIFYRLTIDKVVSLYENIGNKFLSKHRRKKINNLNFTIISNNCWGGHCYRHYGLPYFSPTVGLYFFAEEYIKLLRNLEENIKGPLKFISIKDSKYAKELYARNQENVPVGVLNNNIEIVFLHYKTKEEAYEKWKRRVKRINFDKLIVKFSEMNLCEMKHIIEFEKMPYKNKILLLGQKYNGINSGIVVKRYTNDKKEVVNDTLYYFKFINLNKLINSIKIEKK